MASGVDRPTLSIGDATFESSKLESFIKKLRSIGTKELCQISTRGNERQYVVCGVFSHEEIETTGDNETTIYGGRLHVQKNEDGRHGEAILFDPDGLLRAKNNAGETRKKLDEMKQMFSKKFGTTVVPYIVLLSHHIPCTVEGHTCARLIREYVTQTNDQIIVSYDFVWPGTDVYVALKHLGHPNIGVVTPESTSRPSMLKRLSNRKEVIPRKRKTTNKWSTVERPDGGDGSKKKRPSFIRQKSDEDCSSNCCVDIDQTQVYENN